MEKQAKPLEGVELLLDRVIIEKIPVKDEVRETGFTVPAAAREANINLPKYGFIVACGPGVTKVKPGDKICFLFYSGTPLSIGEKQFLIMREFDIVFVLTKKQ